ncbi:MAG: hypothetical protein M1825_005344 [Sarcosagium campestre]|nr:MAG: hypothetical protein M1825_005344 [Sarcosagium campestre]
MTAVEPYMTIQPTRPLDPEHTAPVNTGDSPAAEEQDELELTVHHHGKPLTFYFPPDASIADLSDTVQETLSIPPSHQKFMITPRPGIIKPPFENATLSLATVQSRKIVLMGSTLNEVASIDVAASQSRSPRRRGRLGGSAKPARRRDWKKDQEEALYTFTTLRPLDYLPHPDRSLRFLERLRSDPGIKATMRKHRWTVPLLTEMDPAAHTTHESRTLGLNRNRGEVIELRLRTDAYDGYRDYRVIRNTLCHELTHNVFGDHDRNFWDLCKQVEHEVERADWKSGGRALTGQEFYEPDQADNDHVDGGGWTGGEYVLGSNPSVGGPDTASGNISTSRLSRREILARAAEERAKKQKQIGNGQGGASQGDSARD